MRVFAMIALTFGLTYAYLYPGSALLVRGSQTATLSDGTDITSTPYIWDQLRFQWDHHPSRFLYGAIYADAGDPEHGYAIWSGWSERFLVLLCTYLVPIEQVSAALTVLLIFINVLAMYGFGRERRWPPWLAFALAVAWGLSYYVRARAQVHSSLAGVFHIPLLFLGLSHLARDPRWRAVAIAAVCFLLAVTVPHYYVITAAFLSPVFLLFVKKPWPRQFGRLVLAALPAVLFLTLNLTFKLPADAALSSAEALPDTGRTANGELHPFLAMFGARPVDYFTGNLGLSRGPLDPNGLKQVLNETVYTSLVQSSGNGNTHERTNGVHWILWAIFLFVLARSRVATNRGEMVPYLVVGIAALLLSLPPAMLWQGPAAWLYRLVPQMRVPSRAGIWVHFAVLAIIGDQLSANLGALPWARVRAWPLALLALIVIEDPPFYNLARTAPVEAPFAALARTNGPCGIGMDFPFVSNDVAQIPFYQFLSRLRQTDCRDLNSSLNPVLRRRLTEAFPPAENYLRQLGQDALTPMRLARLARCVPLSYLAFDPVVKQSFVKSVCDELRWSNVSPGLCVSPNRGAPLARSPADCL